VTPARIVLAAAALVAATGCAMRLSPARPIDQLTISIEGESHEIQTFKPVRPKPAARPFLIIRATDVAVLRPPGRYWLHLVAGSAARSCLVLALGFKGDRTVGDVLTLAPHLDRMTAGPYSMEDRWEWHFYAMADGRLLHGNCRPIQ
jgi:hypothetical protein